MQSLNRIFRALADPTRLRLLNLLLDAPACVCELEQVLGLPQSLVSRHLGYLRNAGLVQDRREGTRVNYSLALEGDLGRELRNLLRNAFLRDDTYRKDIRRRKRKNNSRFVEEPVDAPPMEVGGGLRSSEPIREGRTL